MKSYVPPTVIQSIWTPKEIVLCLHKQIDLTKEQLKKSHNLKITSGWISDSRTRVLGFLLIRFLFHFPTQLGFKNRDFLRSFKTKACSCGLAFYFGPFLCVDSWTLIKSLLNIGSNWNVLWNFSHGRVDALLGEYIILHVSWRSSCRAGMVPLVG